MNRRTTKREQVRWPGVEAQVHIRTATRANASSVAAGERADRGSEGNGTCRNFVANGLIQDMQ